MAENENLASILVKSGLISIFTNSPIGYFSKFANDWREGLRTSPATAVDEFIAKWSNCMRPW